MIASALIAADADLHRKDPKTELPESLKQMSPEGASGLWKLKAAFVIGGCSLVCVSIYRLLEFSLSVPIGVCVSYRQIVATPWLRPGIFGSCTVCGSSVNRGFTK